MVSTCAKEATEDFKKLLIKEGIDAGTAFNSLNTPVDSIYATKESFKKENKLCLNLAKQDVVLSLEALQQMKNTGVQGIELECIDSQRSSESTESVEINQNGQYLLENYIHYSEKSKMITDHQEEIYYDHSERYQRQLSEQINPLSDYEQETPSNSNIDFRNYNKNYYEDVNVQIQKQQGNMFKKNGKKQKNKICTLTPTYSPAQKELFEPKVQLKGLFNENQYEASSEFLNQHGCNQHSDGRLLGTRIDVTPATDRKILGAKTQDDDEAVSGGDPVVKLKAKLYDLLQEQSSDEEQGVQRGERSPSEMVYSQRVSMIENDNDNENNNLVSQYETNNMLENNISMKSGVLDMYSPDNYKYNINDQKHEGYLKDEKCQIYEKEEFQEDNNSSASFIKMQVAQNIQNQINSQNQAYQNADSDFRDLLELPCRLQILQKQVSNKKIDYKNENLQVELNQVNDFQEEDQLTNDDKMLKSSLKSKMEGVVPRRSLSSKKVIFDLSFIQTKEFEQGKILEDQDQGQNNQQDQNLTYQQKLDTLQQDLNNIEEASQDLEHNKNPIIDVLDILNRKNTFSAGGNQNSGNGYLGSQSFRLTPEPEKIEEIINNKSGLLSEDSDRYYELKEENLTDFFSRDNSMLIINNQNIEGHQNVKLANCIDQENNIQKYSTQQYKDTFKLQKVVDYQETVSKGHTPEVKKTEIFLKEFEENDYDYEEEINKTTPQLKYKTQLQTIKEAEIERERQLRAKNELKISAENKEKETISVDQEKALKAYRSSLDANDKENTRKADRYHTQTKSPVSIRIQGNRDLGIKNNGETHSPNLTPTRTRVALGSKNVIDAMNRSPLQQQEHHDHNQQQKVALNCQDKDFQAKFNEKARQYLWKGDAHQAITYNTTTAYQGNSITKPGKSKSQKVVQYLSVNGDGKDSVSNGSVKKQGQTNKIIEGSKGVSTRHLEFLNRTLGYAAMCTGVQYGRNNSATKMTSNYGKSMSKTSYLNSTINNVSIASRLKEIDQKIAEAKKTAFSKAGPLFSANQRSSSLGYGKGNNSHTQGNIRIEGK